ncbi:MAG TPA: hypothetical protein VG147_02715 [Solirubrobacteraceae bacterium]|nr:hypothetical protein [Solirubrobacteraceae bacterium]
MSEIALLTSTASSLAACGLTILKITAARKPRQRRKARPRSMRRRSNAGPPRPPQGQTQAGEAKSR